MKKTDDQIWNQLIYRIQKYLKKMGLPKLKDTSNHSRDGYGYHSDWHKDDGYIDIYTKDWSNDLEILFRTDSEDEMLYYVLEKEAQKYSRQYELDNRKKFETQWHYLTNHYNPETGKWDENPSDSWIYDLRYDGRKYSFEKEISLLSKVLPKERLDELTKAYVDDMNLWFYHPRWDFDRERMEFFEVSDEPEHD